MPHDLWHPLPGWFEGMCGRFTQHRPLTDYLHELGWRDLPGPQTQEQRQKPSWNVAPGTYPWLMHRFLDGQPGIDQVHWGYRPKWAEEKRLPMAINARLEKAGSSRFFGRMWKTGRAIVPADGWYEWTGETGHKQPWYIHPKSDHPIFLAAITNFQPEEGNDHAGFAIVTAASAGGMLDVHDRRPVVLSSDDAQLWLDPDLPAEQAEYLVRAMALTAEVFGWHKVSRDVNRASNNDPHLIELVS